MCFAYAKTASQIDWFSAVFQIDGTNGFHFVMNRILMQYTSRAPFNQSALIYPAMVP